MHKIFNWMRNGNGNVTAGGGGMSHKERISMDSADFDSFGTGHNAAVSALKIFISNGGGHHKHARTLHGGGATAENGLRPLIKPLSTIGASGSSLLLQPYGAVMPSPQPSRSGSFRDTFRGLRQRLTPRRKNGTVDMPPVVAIAEPAETKHSTESRRRPPASPIVAIYVNKVERNLDSVPSACTHTVTKISQSNVISIETVDEDKLSQMSQLSTSFMTSRKFPDEASTLRGSMPTLYLTHPERHDHTSSSTTLTPTSTKPIRSSGEDAAPLTGRRTTLGGFHHRHRRSSITSGSGESPGRRPATSSVDALLHNAGVSQDNLAKDEIRYVREAPVFNVNSAPITRTTCDIAANRRPSSDYVGFIPDTDHTTVTVAKPVARKPSANEHPRPVDAARHALVAATAAALPTAAVEVIGVALPTADAFPPTLLDASSPSTLTSPPPSERMEQRRLRFLVPQISVSSVDSVPRAIAHAHAKTSVPTSGSMTQSASAAVGNNFFHDFVDNSAPTLYDSADGVATAIAMLSTSDASPALQRQGTASDAMRRRASLAARRQSNVQLVQKAVGRRTSKTFVPLTPAQIHLVRALWRQVYLTKGPTVVGQTLMHRLFFKAPKLKELFRACPLAADGHYSNHDHFAKLHCKAVGEMIEQVVDNLDDLQAVELELENIGRTHARLMNGVLSSKVWNSMAETFIDCTLGWGDRRSRSETVRKTWALIVAFVVEKIKRGHLDEHKQTMAIRSAISSLENVAMASANIAVSAPPALPAPGSGEQKASLHSNMSPSF